MVTLRIEIMWTKVSCWLCCMVINWLVLILMLLTSLVVAVPVNHLKASPRKSGILPLIYLLETKTPSSEGSFFISCVAARISGL